MRFLFSVLTIIVTIIISSSVWAGNAPTPALMGTLGLNTTPSARMDAPGTIRFNISTLDPYIQGTMGFQLAPRLYIGIRQTAEISRINGAASKLFPGIDLRFLLAKESPHRPQIALGLQSAIGHKRMAGEYLAFSKRYKDIDFNGGLAWGRLGSAAHMSNPLKALHNHFGKKRALDGAPSNAPKDWFTGEDIGFFGGIEYFSPHIHGLSIKADWGADRYIVEQSLSDYDAPSPWAIGVNYTPQHRFNMGNFFNIGAALIGGQKIMGTITMRSPLTKWQGRPYKKTKAQPMNAKRTAMALPAKMALEAERNNILLYETKRSAYNVSAKLLLDHNRPLPLQLGRSVRHIANHAGQDIEELRVTPLSYGLEGRELRLQRRDLEQALIHKQGSPQEIWRNVSFNSTPNNSATKNSATKNKNLLHNPFNAFDDYSLRLILENDLSLSEEDNGLLYRTGLIIEDSQKLSEHFWFGSSLRLDLKDNLILLNRLRPAAILPVRSNIDVFAQRTVSLDRNFLSWMTTLKPDLYISLTSGLLEEMYAGFGGEILYRPFGKTFAIGAEAYQVFKRDPYSAFNLGLNGDHLMSGHVNAWYEFPDSDLTLQARIGRYLAEDIGGTLALQKEFKTGVKLKAFITATNRTNSTDLDLFGSSSTHIYSGLKLSLPLGNVKYIPEGSEIRTIIAPLGRDAGQILDAPVKLYDVSEKLSYRHIMQNWTDVVE